MVLTLTPEQSQVVEDHVHNIFVAACPGSGKTRVIVEKLIRELQMDNRVVAITYTNKAAQEIQQRVQNRMDTNANFLWAGTIHKFCLDRILIPFGERCPEIGCGFEPATDEDCVVVENIVKRELLLLPGNKSLNYGIEIDGTPVDKRNPQAMETAYTLFLEMGKLHYDQILWYSNVLLRDNPDIAELLASEIDFLAVDEYQDTQKLQFEVLMRLAAAGGPGLRFLVVGDPEQAIYLGPGIEPLSHKQLEDKLGKTFIQVRLDKNYRSEPHIVEFFRRFQVEPASIVPMKESSGTGSLTHNHVHYTDLGAQVIDMVRYTRAQGVPVEDICVMAPTWWMLQDLVNRLEDFPEDVDFVYNMGAEQGKPGLKLDTTVGVKGAEYHTVIVFGLMHGVLPHWVEIIESMDGGFTKAMHKLYVLASRAEVNLHFLTDIERPVGKQGSKYTPAKLYKEMVINGGGIPEWQKKDLPGIS